MRFDPVVAIARELEIADRAFDQAVVKGDQVTSRAAGDFLISLTRALHVQTPTTGAGAAILLREAADVLEENTDLVSRDVLSTIKPIAARLARGKRSDRDAELLRAAHVLSTYSNSARQTPSAPNLIARALIGATAE